MSFYNPAMRGMRLIVNLGFDRVWFALAVIACLFLASWMSDLLLQWFAAGQAQPVRGAPAL